MYTITSSSNGTSGDSWEERRSTTHPGRVYYVNKETKEKSWINPKIMCDDYYQQLRQKRQKEKAKDIFPYQIGGVKRPRNSSVVDIVFEDQPSHGILREQFLNEALDILARENEKYGEMTGNSKMTKSIKKDGMRIGLQGLFARIVWFALLEEVRSDGDVGNPRRDSIFPRIFNADPNVLKELVEEGRTKEQAHQIVYAVGKFMEHAARRMCELRSLTTLKNEPEVVSLRQLSSQSQFELSYNGVSLQISDFHLKKLLRLYKLHTDPSATLSDAIFLRRAFCVIQRYESLSGKSDGYQMAFPDAGFQWLREEMGVKIECFASPLNCWNQRFCSVSRDTDRFFGSLGNFFLFEGHTGVLTEEDSGLPLGGSFEANPPFVEAVMNDMAVRIDYLLEKYSDAPFSIIVVVPAWYDCAGVMQMTASKFNRPHPGYVLVLEKKMHDYRPGMQHRTSHDHQPSNVDTLMFFLQNDKGAEKWPYRKEMGENLKEMLIKTSIRSIDA